MTDLLALTRAEMGHLQMDLQPLCVFDAVQQAIAPARDRRPTLFSLSSGEPRPPHDPCLADRDRVVQCLVN